jgi:hypothetical protein
MTISQPPKSAYTPIGSSAGDDSHVTGHTSLILFPRKDPSQDIPHEFTRKSQVNPIS